MSDDLAGDLDLAAHGIERYERTFELPGCGQLIENVRNGGDLVGLFRHAELRQDQPGVGGVGAERVQGFKPLAAIMGAARGLAVDGDEGRAGPATALPPSSGSSDRTGPDQPD